MAIHCFQYVTELDARGRAEVAGRDHTMTCFMGNNADRSRPLNPPANVKCHPLSFFSLRLSFVSHCCLSPHQIENVDACLSFLDARGVNVQGLSAEGKKNQEQKSEALSKLLIE